MKAIKASLKDLEEMVKAGACQDVSLWDEEDLPQRFRVIAYAAGAYGYSGILAYDVYTGRLVFCGRTTNIYHFI